MNPLSQLIKEVGMTGLIDIVCMSIVIYFLIIWFKRSKAIFVLIGLLLIGAIYLAAREFNLQLMAVVLQGFFAVILIAIIVIFQEEIKHLFERLAIWSLKRRHPRQQVLHLSRKEVEILVRTLTDLANEKVGALIVLRGQDILARHINGGWDLNGEMSEPLLKSLFDPHSLGHDGAVIIENNRILQFGCHLPLSKDLKNIPRGGGTRHAAGLGLSELTDALCLIVSEERGTISVARNGEIDTIPDPELLNLVLQRFYEENSPSEQTEGRNIFTHNFKEKAVAVTLTAVLWFFFVHESRLTYKSFRVPVEFVNLPEELSITEVMPETVEVTFSGPRRHFYFVTKNRIRFVLNMAGETEGFRSKQIQKSNVVFPDKLEFENVIPNKIKVVLKDTTKAESIPPTQ